MRETPHIETLLHAEPRVLHGTSEPLLPPFTSQPIEEHRHAFRIVKLSAQRRCQGRQFRHWHGPSGIQIVHVYIDAAERDALPAVWAGVIQLRAAT